MLDGLRGNSTLSVLNLSSNSVGTSTIESLCTVLGEGATPLTALDLSVNNIDERSAEVRWGPVNTGL